MEHSQEAAFRRKKLLDIKNQAPDAFPNDFRPNAKTAQLQEQFQDADGDVLATSGTFKLAGRIIAKRVLGKSVFLQLQDGDGLIQLYCQRDLSAESLYQRSIANLDLGDIVGVCGTLFKTKTQELTVRLEALSLLTKALRPLPDKFHGLVDVEQRYRQRYLDLIVNPQTRKTFLLRSRILQAMRQFFNDRGYLEVETPMLQTLAGGASARPFETYHNALGIPLYLRIAPELYLKRLIVGGFEKVFEINRNFRNEGISTRHNPEFTMCEFYLAYADYQVLMDLTETLLREVSMAALGTLQFESLGHTYDLSQPFLRITLKEAVAKHCKLPIKEMESTQTLESYCRAQACKIPFNASAEELQYAIFEQCVEPTLMAPTFVLAYPSAVSPLARRNVQNPKVADRFELFVGGRELANGFSELNDPEVQAACFQAQMEAKGQGDLEAMPYDADYIAALEQGMPPTAGEGIGIDRLVMWLANCASIRDVILFPTLKPVAQAVGEID